MKSNLMLDIFQEIAAERGRQDAKWGEQNHPLVCQAVRDVHEEHHHYLDMAERMRQHNDWRVEHNAMAWDTILREEVYEAFGEHDEQAAREELVQVAAVVVAMIESIDRRKGRAA